MDAPSDCVARIAAAIGDPARSRILFCLMDRRARTSTELSVVADVGASTASAHLARLRDAGLVNVVAQGKHRYYRLAGADVAVALEQLAVIAGAAERPFVSSTPRRLRMARTCYDHIAGRLGVALHDALLQRGWLEVGAGLEDYAPSVAGTEELGRLGIDVATLAAKRRSFARACLDWSERRSHLAGALGAAFLELCAAKGWVEREPDGRSLTLTERGEDGLARTLGITIDAARTAGA